MDIHSYDNSLYHICIHQLIKNYMEELEQRMYFFVPYQLTGIQQGIQSGHAALEFALRYGRYNPNHMIWTFIEKHKTWVILNGGTTNHGYAQANKGSLDEIYRSIIVYNVEARLDDKIDVEKFCEPDLNNALTAVCFVCDERVFNKEKYPDFFKYLTNMGIKNDFRLRELTPYELKETYSYYHEQWLELIGGPKNEFLKELLDGKKLA
jgi:hypothetical protein